MNVIFIRDLAFIFNVETREASFLVNIEMTEEFFLLLNEFQNWGKGRFFFEIFFHAYPLLRNYGNHDWVTCH